MSGEIIQARAAMGMTRDLRRASRGVSRVQGLGLVRVASVDSDTDVAIAKIEGLTMATADAMSAVARVARTQTQLEQLVPEAAGRLAFLAEAHAMAMGDVLQDLRRDLQRR